MTHDRSPETTPETSAASTRECAKHGPYAVVFGCESCAQERTAATEFPFVLPSGYRWATGGGSPIGDCNGRHIAIDDGRRGTLCGRYGPAPMHDPKYEGDVPCKVCVKSLRRLEAM